jgi:hypothetical protein
VPNWFVASNDIDFLERGILDMTLVAEVLSGKVIGLVGPMEDQLKEAGRLRDYLKRRNKNMTQHQAGETLYVKLVQGA